MTIKKRLKAFSFTLIAPLFISLTSVNAQCSDQNSDSPLGKLNWGGSCGSGSTTWTSNKLKAALKDSAKPLLHPALTHSLQRIVAVTAATEINLPLPKAVPVLLIEQALGPTPWLQKGIASTFDPVAFQSSQASMSKMNVVFDLALCSKIADSPQDSQCKDKAVSSILDWVNTYKPTGDPINEFGFVEMFKAIDLVLPSLSVTNQALVSNWVKQFATMGDQYYSHLKPDNEVQTNNWNSWRLAIRGLAAQITNDPSLIQSTKDLLKKQIQANFQRNPDGSLLDGSTIDFKLRDAIHYQVYDLDAYSNLVQFTPCLLDGDSKKAIDAGLNFLKPYISGEKQHAEYVNSTVIWDKIRDKTGSLGNTIQGTPIHIGDNWTPDNETYNLLRVSKPIFQDLSTWTSGSSLPAQQQIVQQNFYSPKTKVTAALFGETEEYIQKTAP